jgi:two-component system phosphate regulon response regulator OmpR
MVLEDSEILVVDSAEQRRAAIVRCLRDEGFRVTAVAEGLAALRAIGKREFALMIAAVELPGALDGAATLRQARSRQPGLRALFVADYPRLPRFPDPGGEDVLAWPMERRELLGCVFERLHRSDAAFAGLASRCRTERHAV